MARYAALDKEQQDAYKASLKIYRDNYAIMKTERDEGRAEGLAEGIELGKEEERIKTMHMLKDSGFSIERIAELYKIPVTDVKRLLFPR